MEHDTLLERLQQRIMSLEELLTHLERRIEDLDGVILAQQRQIDELHRQAARASLEIGTLRTAKEQTDSDE